MRSGSISLLSFAALAASMAEGAAIPAGASGTSSLPSSRRSSIASTSSTTLPSSSSSSPTTSTFAETTTSAAAAKGRPYLGGAVFKDPFSTTSTTSSSSSSSSTTTTTSTSSTSMAPDSTVSPFADPSPIVAAAGRPVIAAAPAKVTTTSTTTSRTSSLSGASPVAAAVVGGGRPILGVPAKAGTTTTSTRSSSITTRSTSISSSPLRTSSISASSSSSTSSPAVVTSSSSSTKSSSIAATSTTTSVLPTSSSITTQSSLKSSTTVKPSSSTAALVASGAVEALMVQKTTSSSSTFSSAARPSLATIVSSSALPTASSIPSMSSSAAPKISTSTQASSSVKSSTSTIPTSTIVSSTTSKAVTSSVRPSSSAKPSAASSSAFIASSVVSAASQSASKSKAASSAATSATRSLSSMSTSTKTAIAVATTAAAIAAAYMDFGCWQDSSASRTMTGPSYVDTTGMTQESCAKFCAASGMPFSGTEYGQECYCSSTAPTSDNAWWCNMPCTGNSSEICGSGNALSVLYNSAAVQTSAVSTNLGCYADSSSMRTMTGPSFSSDSMTNELCSNFCTAYNYPYSGTEYGSQCYCSDVLPWSAPVGCSMPCAGDSSQICGDGNALAVTRTSNSSQTVDSASTQNSTKLNTAVNMNQTYQDWSSWKARGVNLGNWLVLERWMHLSWFDATASGAVDEWTFCSQLGKAACTSALQQHWASWIDGDDIANMASMGTNTLRIPVGFWAFIDPLDSEPYVRSTQLQELSRVLGLAAAHGMTCIVDIHGLPGSQNGKDHSGHVGSVEFYSDANQKRSLAAVQAAATWVANSGYAGSTITALEVANEPDIADWATWLKYKDYVLASHQIVQSTVPSVSTMFHDGFWPLEPWNQFFSGSDNAVLDTHKYWAFAPTTLQQATSDVCSYIETFSNVNLPVFIGEFSLSVDANVSDFAGYAQGFFQSQMAVWLQAAGAAFWSIKSYNADGVTQNPAWSAEGILSSGVFNEVWDLSNVTCTA